MSSRDGSLGWWNEIPSLARLMPSGAVHPIIAGLDPAIHERLQSPNSYHLYSSSDFMDCRVKPGNDPWRERALAPQHAAGALWNLGDDLGGECVDLLLGHGLFTRLNPHGDGDRFLAGLAALAFLGVEYPN